jgi:two-component system response regulator AtoC
MCKHILILDDEPGFQKLLSEILTQAGYHVKCAGSAAEALKLTAAQKMDLLFIDNRMPGMSGLEFLRLLRSTNDWTPAIIMTAYADMPVVVDSIRLGACDFLIKPFQIDTVIPAVEQCLASTAEISEPGPKIDTCIDG